MPFITGMFQDGVGHGRATPGERLHPVGRLGDFEADVLQDATGHLTDHPAVVDDKAGLQTDVLHRPLFSRGDG
jgi:hypothetical protein